MAEAGKNKVLKSGALLLLVSDRAKPILLLCANVTQRHTCHSSIPALLRWLQATAATNEPVEEPPQYTLLQIEKEPS